MINLYSARENIDKERFIYENIQGEVLVIVPNQYTLVAEEQALKYLDKRCLYDVEVLSMNRLGLRILQEQGKESAKMLDKYGRFMLLSKIIKKHKNELKIFAKSAGKTGFTNMLSDFISSFKQQNCTIAELDEMINSADTDELLKSKLSELRNIVLEYEESIAGKYTDSEDYIAKYIDAIKDSKFLRNKEIWIYGYDTITPKFTSAILQLALVSRNVNMLLNESDFKLEETITKTISYQAKELSIDTSYSPIGEQNFQRAGRDIPSLRTGSEPLCQANVSEEREGCSSSQSADKLFSQNSEPLCQANVSETQEGYCPSQSGDSLILSKTETISRIERGLFSDNLSNSEAISNQTFIPEDLKIVRAANPYYEAESAANFVYHLIRDKGYKMRDIQIIANDEGTMQPIIKRTFEEYGLPVFLDQSRNITDTAAVNFVVNLLKFERYSKSESIITMLKTGLAGIDYSDAEELENYCKVYHIKGNMWRKPFKYYSETLGEEKFAKIEKLREEIISKLLLLDEIVKSDSVKDFVDRFKNYLNESWNLEISIQKLVDEQIENNLHDEAQRMVQSYRKAIELLDQVVEIMGDEPFELQEFLEIYLAGLTNVEVGVIPPTLDGLSVGTMIRTRPRATKAVAVLGANEGTLPLQASSDGLFSIDEKTYFDNKGFALGKLDDIKMAEENVAMYRMLSKPSEKLYISYSMTDVNGGEQAASSLIDNLIDLFPRIEKDALIEKDIISSGWSADRINSPDESMRHLINHIKDRNTYEIDPLSEATIAWFEKNKSDDIKRMLEIVQDENTPKPLGKERAKSLYSRKDGSLVLSASALSSYFDCPFKYFVDRGLRPQEERIFESDPRSIGDVYHKCLEIVAARIIRDRAYGVKLLECSDEEIEKIINEELSAIAKDYNSGLFISCGNEEYRMERIKEICQIAVRSLAKQLTSSTLISASLEESFGKSGVFKPVEFEVDETKVYVEGKIDRLDILSGDRARVVDYKTGSDRLDMWKMANGYKMQLMIYMMSATSEKYEPAGMFYFNISDPMESLNGASKSKKDVLPEDTYKLKGKFVDEPGVLESMPKEVLAGSRNPSVTREEFDELKLAVTTRMKEIAAGISSGNIEIRPFKEDKKLVCNYCSYKSICKRDRTFVRNMAREIKAKTKEKDGE